MKNPPHTSVFVLLLLAAPSLAYSQEPTKEALVETLSTVCQLLADGKYAESEAYFYIPDEFRGEFREAASKFIEKREISKEGIDVLKESATFGKASEVFGEERAKRITDRMKVEVGDAWGFYHETETATGEVLAVWKDGKFKIGRLDDVGKLQPKVASPAEADKMVELGLKLEAERDFLQAWSKLSKAHELGNRSLRLQEGMNRLMSRFANVGLFAVGVTQDSLLNRLGKPQQKVELGRGRTRWVYGSWGIDFHSNLLHGIIDLRGATEALFKPTEKLSIDLPGDNWSTQFREKRKGYVIAYLYTEKYTNVWKEQFTVERFLDAASLNAASFAERQIDSLKQRNAEAKHKFLAKGETWVIYAEEIPLVQEKTSLHRLTRLLEGRNDMHKITYTVRSSEPPGMATQMKWLAIFKSAELELIGKTQQPKK